MEVRIDKFDDLGDGLTKINDKVCFVKRGLPDELVNVTIVKNNKRYSKAIINNIINASKNRTQAICKYYDKCGGCNFLHTKEDLEINFKIKKALKFLGICNDFYETITYNYRNKVKLHVKDGLIGLYEAKSNNLVTIDYCYLLNNNINQVIKILNQYKDSSFNGIVTIRENKLGEIILIIEGNYRYIDKLKNKNTITNLIYNNQVIKGHDYFYEYILDYKFKVSYDSFFQVNRLGLQKISKILSSFLKDKCIDIVLDLYSGTSVLGIMVANYVNKVISVESNPSASKDAYYNVKLNKIQNLEIINDKVENVINKFSNIDLVIVDPTRNGLDLKTIKYLKDLKSQYIIYIACSIDSLRRDFQSLNTYYDLENLYLVDMFPRTNNFECVGILNLKEGE